MKKLLFFDIDGTLVDDDGSIPASTIQAIASAQKAGHLTFINTGRMLTRNCEQLALMGLSVAVEQKSFIVTKFYSINK